MAVKCLIMLVALLAWTVSINPNGIETDQQQDFGCDGHDCIEIIRDHRDSDAVANERTKRSNPCEDAGGTCIPKKKQDKCKKSINRKYACSSKNKVCCIEEINECLTTSSHQSVLYTKMEETETSLTERNEELQNQFYQMDRELNRKLDQLLECCVETTAAPPTTSPTITPTGCECGDIVANHDGTFTKSCFEVKCNNGDWELTGNFDINCGECIFGGEPLVYPFDPMPSGKPLSVNISGEYAMAQTGFDPIPGTFGVNGRFTNPSVCGTNGFGNCIDGTTYYEDGIAVWLYIEPNSAGPIQVYKNDKIESTQPPPPGSKGWRKVPGKDIGNGNEVKCVASTDGRKGVLVFKQDRIIGGGNAGCTIIIGSKGLTVAMCEGSMFNPVGYPLPWAYIYAKETLKSAPSSNSLYGLCNTYTGTEQNCFYCGISGGGKGGFAHCGPTEWQNGNNRYDIPILHTDRSDTWEVIEW